MRAVLYEQLLAGDRDHRLPSRGELIRPRVLREDLWSDDPNLKDRKNPVETAKQYQQHILGGIKWALGLAEGSAEVNNALP